MVVTFATNRPVPGDAALAVVGFLVLVLGQLWTVAATAARMPPEPPWPPLERFTDLFRMRRKRRELLPGVSARANRLLTLVALAMWLGGMASVFAVDRPPPGDPGLLCTYVLSNGGKSRCVDKATYDDSHARRQRFFATTLAVFYFGHTAASWNERRLVNRPA